MPPEIPPPLSFASMLLRLSEGMSQKEAAEAAGISASLLCSYESGDRKLSRDRLEALAAAWKVPPERVEVAAFCAALLLPAPPVSGSVVEVSAEVRRRIDAAAARAGRTAVEVTREELIREAQWAQAEEDRRKARELRDVLKRHPFSSRIALVEEAKEYQTWYVAEELCAESIRAAADDPNRALEWADLALRSAEQVSGEAEFSYGVQAYAWGHVGNARRVSSDLPGATNAFTRAWELWDPEKLADLWPLDGSRLFDLEASLLRDQRYMTAALERLDQALAIHSTGEATGRILLKKSKTLEQMGDFEGSIQALTQAAPWIDRTREPRNFCILTFNLQVNLCHVGRHREAEAALPDLRAIVTQLGNGLDGVRLRWLEGRVASGLGRIEEGIEALSRVRTDLAELKLRFDEALVGMELAELYLKQGRTAEVKTLVRQMEPIFRDQGVHEEAQKALDLFRQAVELETVTLELVRRLIAYLYLAQHNPELRFEEAA